MEGFGVFFSALVLAFIVEAVLEYVLGIWWRPLSEEMRPKVLMAVGLALGIALSLAYRVDLLTELGLAPSILGRVLTGALIGRGADYLHGFWKKLKP